MYGTSNLREPQPCKVTNSYIYLVLFVIALHSID